MAKERKSTSGKSESAAKKSRTSTPSTGAKKTAAKKAASAKPSPAKKAAKATAPKAPAKKAAPKKSPVKKKATPVITKAPAAKKSASKPKKTTAGSAEAEVLDLAVPAANIEDAIGDVSDGEGQHLLEDAETETSDQVLEAYRADTDEDAELDVPQPKASRIAIVADTEEDNEFRAEPRGEAHLERLQKILSQAGIASRRHAEEMITAGRVMVNGQVVTQLGAKADPDRDHIRVDTKLIQHAERHRTFLLNKPRGYVTTVSDPEGRPTVADLFSKFRERLYPVGRLDFQSEGLLLMTNDGELANLLTRASSGVEKTYVVKVAGQLSGDQLNRLREGVSIEKAEQGSQRVRSAPAEVHLIRPGDNPWYEVILIEGRNREIRKMFSATGHFVEKIRRVAYGPLVLDVEPGSFRELTPEELNVLRLTAEGKMRPRRPKTAMLLPKEAGIPAEERAAFRGKQRRGGDRPRGEGRGPRNFEPRGERRFEPRGERRPGPDRNRGERGPQQREGFGGRFEKRPFNREGRPVDQENHRREDRPDQNRFQQGRSRDGGNIEGRRPEGRRPAGRPPEGRSFDRSERPAFRREGGEDTRGDRPFNRPRPQRDARGSFRAPGGERRGFGGGRPPNGAPRGDRPQGDRPRSDRPRGDRPAFDRKPRFDRRESGDRPAREERPRREFRPREEGSENFERRKPFGAPRTGTGGAGGQRSERPRFESRGGRPGGAPRFQRNSGNGRGRPGFGARPGGFRKGPGGPPRKRDTE